jgi:hypothetical protein
VLLFVVAFGNFCPWLVQAGEVTDAWSRLLRGLAYMHARTLPGRGRTERIGDFLSSLVSEDPGCRNPHRPWAR